MNDSPEQWFGSIKNFQRTARKANLFFALAVLISLILWLLPAKNGKIYYLDTWLWAVVWFLVESICLLPITLLIVHPYAKKFHKIAKRKMVAHYLFSAWIGFIAFILELVVGEGYGLLSGFLALAMLLGVVVKVFVWRVQREFDKADTIFP